MLALVLLAAIAHAAWNGWLKKSSPDFVGLAVLALGQCLVAGYLLLAAVGNGRTTQTTPVPRGYRWRQVGGRLHDLVVVDDGRTRRAGRGRQGNEHPVCSSDRLGVSRRKHIQTEVDWRGPDRRGAGRRQAVRAGV